MKKIFLSLLITFLLAPLGIAQDKKTQQSSNSNLGEKSKLDCPKTEVFTEYCKNNSNSDKCKSGNTGSDTTTTTNQGPATEGK
jgi:hypothetical protein